MIVAIDGHAAAGKTTVSSLVAEGLNCPILQSGLIYRALGWKALQEGIDLVDERALTELAEHTSIELRLEDNSALVDGCDVTDSLRTSEVDGAASAVAGFHPVRKQLMPLQRMAACGGDIVAEGRDMGSVVFPEAEFKFFLTAPLEVRAERRRNQLARQGEDVPLEKIIKQIAERDEKDAAREFSPLIAAPDAIGIDTAGRDASAVAEEILATVKT